MTGPDQISPARAGYQALQVCALFQSADLRGPGGSAMNLLDCAQDHRRDALDLPAHQVPGAVAVMDLVQAPLHPAPAHRPGWWSCHRRFSTLESA